MSASARSSHARAMPFWQASFALIPRENMAHAESSDTLRTATARKPRSTRSPLFIFGEVLGEAFVGGDPGGAAGVDGDVLRAVAEEAALAREARPRLAVPT